MFDIYEIKKYLDGKTSQYDFLVEVRNAIADIRNRGKTFGSFTKGEGYERITLEVYLMTANSNIQNLMDTSKGDSKILIEAIVCDICNIAAVSLPALVIVHPAKYHADLKA